MAFRLLRRINPKLPSLPLPASPSPPLLHAVRWMSTARRDPLNFEEIHDHICKMQERFDKREENLNRREEILKEREKDLARREGNLGEVEKNLYNKDKKIDSWEEILKNFKEWEKNLARMEENLEELEKNLYNKDKEIDSWEEIVENFKEWERDVKEWEKSFSSRKGRDASSTKTSSKVFFQEWEKSLTEEEFDEATEVGICWEEMKRGKGREFWMMNLKYTKTR